MLLEALTVVRPLGSHSQTEFPTKQQKVLLQTLTKQMQGRFLRGRSDKSKTQNIDRGLVFIYLIFYVGKVEADVAALDCEFSASVGGWLSWVS